LPTMCPWAVERLTAPDELLDAWRSSSTPLVEQQLRFYTILHGGLFESSVREMFRSCRKKPRLRCLRQTSAGLAPDRDRLCCVRELRGLLVLAYLGAPMHLLLALLCAHAVPVGVRPRGLAGARFLAFLQSPTCALGIGDPLPGSGAQSPLTSGCFGCFVASWTASHLHL